MEGWQGWDDYAPFYDWENARTMGRRDVGFWQNVASRNGGPALELGCGTGRVSIPVAATGIQLIGVDRSAEMLARARRRQRRSKTARGLQLVRADIRDLPFGAGSFRLVIAPYGILQSLLDEADLERTLESVSRVLARGGTFGVDLVTDLPAWDEYRGRIRLHGKRRNGTAVTLVESVRQDRERHLTFFDQEYVEQTGGKRVSRRFSLAFRTVSLPEMLAEIEAAGFEVEALLGDYDGRPWDLRAETWLILARRR